MNDPSKLSDVHLSVLHDHYKDSFAHLREYVQLRDRFLAYTLVVLFLLFLDVSSPQLSTTMLSDVLSKYIGLTVSSPSFLRALGWFLLLAASTRYFQTSLLVEKQYPYIHGLESRLNEFYGKPTFDREGKNYLHNFPLFGDWAQILYKWIFPLLLILAATSKIVREFPALSGWTIEFTVNLMLFFSVIVTTVLYLHALHWPEKSSKEKR